MLALLFEAAIRSLVLAVATWFSLKLLQVRNPYAQLTAWIAVLTGALSMPLLVQIAPTFLQFTFPDMTRWLAAFVKMPTGVVLASAEMLTVYGTASHAVMWSAVISGLYSLIAGMLLLRLILGIALTWRLRRRAVRLHGDWTTGFDVRVSKEISAPVSFASTILLPVDYIHWPSAQRRAALSHESSHVARGDFYVQILAGFHRAIFWFSPLAWWLHHHLIALGEFASDADAIGALGNRLSYAEILVDFAARARTVPASIAMARPGTVNLRVVHILSATTLPARLTWKNKLTIAAALLPLVMASAGAATQSSPTVKTTLTADNLLPPVIASADAIAQSSPAVKTDANKLKQRVIVPPRSNPEHPVSQPPYPPEAKAAHQRGVVIMQLTVDASGHVSKAVLHKSSGVDSLDQAAMNEAKSSWQLLPGTVNGKPTTMDYRFAVVFKITDD